MCYNLRSVGLLRVFGFAGFVDLIGVCHNAHVLFVVFHLSNVAAEHKQRADDQERGNAKRADGLPYVLGNFFEKILHFNFSSVLIAFILTEIRYKNNNKNIKSQEKRKQKYVKNT